MRIVDFIKNKTPDAINNPYVLGAAGRKEWNDRYASLAKSVWDWKKAFFAAMALALVLAFGLLHFAAKKFAISKTHYLRGNLTKTH